MHIRKEANPDALELRALYSIGELARFARVPTFKLRRVLKASGVVLLRSGRALYVPLSEIEAKIPPLWQSIAAAERLRQQSREPPVADELRRRPR
jgi:hypothetical protein